MLTRFQQCSFLSRWMQFSANSRHRLLRSSVCLVLATGSIACTYAEQKWKEKLSEFNKGIDQEMEEAKGPRHRCESARGVFYKERCYVPDGRAGMNQERTCRMHGGLYIDGVCLTNRQGPARTF